MVELTLLATILVAALCIASFIHGLVLTFKSSIILGIICLFLCVPYSLIAVVYWITGVDLAERVVRALPELFVI